MRRTIEMTHKLLKENGYTEEDLIEKRDHVIQQLEKRMKVEPRNPYTKEKHILPVLDFVYVTQSNGGKYLF
ncbi:hypothetical protein KA005_67820 [bacterium]|nr:hypothetical protein [bacterium]